MSDELAKMVEGWIEYVESYHGSCIVSLFDHGEYVGENAEGVSFAQALTLGVDWFSSAPDLTYVIHCLAGGML
jgi:hypothetical protein